jgi:hypothetical protein
MSKSSAGWGKNVARWALWAGSGLALIALLVYRVAAASSRSGQPFRPDELGDGVAVFDSFSEPSVACAILRQEGERLLSVYCEQWCAEQATQAGQAGAGRELAAQPGTQASVIQSLTGLDRQVQDFNFNLGLNLLVVYARQHLWNEFVDRYLQIVQERPGRGEIVTWARVALDCSQKCGRAEEVADVLEHVVRFHPELRTAEGLKTALAAWQTERSPGLEVSKR